MTLLQAFILGIVQGITEFFPVSSSAHLRMCKHFFGISDGEHLLYFDLLCHLGTLLALIGYLRRDIMQVLCNKRELLLFFVALMPLVPAYFLLKPLRLALSHPAYLGYCLLISAAFLCIASLLPSFVYAQHAPHDATPLPKRRAYLHALAIGTMQALALVPGISRSGSSITAARLCGWSWKEAAQFSFLLAIPTILGGEFLETIRWMGGSSEALGAILPSRYAVGFATSWGVGHLAVRAVFWAYERGQVLPFAWYCVGAAFVAFTQAPH
jgi:undecaprenyl-diphosphatase